MKYYCDGKLKWPIVKKNPKLAALRVGLKAVADPGGGGPCSPPPRAL